MKTQRKVEVSSTFSLTSALDWGGWSALRPGRFVPGKRQEFLLYRMLSGPQGPSGRVRKISPPTKLRCQDQPVASRYKDWVIPAHKFVCPYAEIMSMCKLYFRFVFENSVLWEVMSCRHSVPSHRNWIIGHAAVRNSNLACLCAILHICIIFGLNILHNRMLEMFCLKAGKNDTLLRNKGINKQKLNIDRRTWFHSLYYFTIYCSTCFEC